MGRDSDATPEITFKFEIMLSVTLCIQFDIFLFRSIINCNIPFFGISFDRI